MKQLRAQLRGMDADVYFLAVGSGSQELIFNIGNILVAHHVKIGMAHTEMSQNDCLEATVLQCQQLLWLAKKMKLFY